MIAPPVGAPLRFSIHISTVSAAVRAAPNANGDRSTAISTVAAGPVASAVATTSYAPGTRSRPSISNWAASSPEPASRAVPPRLGWPPGSCRNAMARSRIDAVATVTRNGRAESARKNRRRTAPGGSADRSRTTESDRGVGTTTDAVTRTSGPMVVSDAQPVTVPTWSPGPRLEVRIEAATVVRGGVTETDGGTASQRWSLRSRIGPGRPPSKVRTSAESIPLACTLNPAPAARDPTRACIAATAGRRRRTASAAITSSNPGPTSTAVVCAIGRALAVMACLSCAAVTDRRSARAAPTRSATAPATCGEAMLVPFFTSSPIDQRGTRE
jgi:hypothetical protein